MAKKTQKNFYAVRAGRKVGIYTTWDDCKEQVNGHLGAIVKGFITLAEAQQFMNEGPASARYRPVLQAPPATQTPTPTRTPTINQLRTTPTPSSNQLQTTPTPTINGLRAAAVKVEPARPEIGMHSRVDALRKDAVKVERQDDGPGCYFEKFSSQEQNFEPDVKAEFSQEFDRLASSQGWARGSPEYKTERVTALSDEVWRHFFKDALRETDTRQFPDREDRERLRKLRGFQALCRAVGRQPGDTLVECKLILKGTLVNIVDLIDACRTGKRLEVWTDFPKFKRYTLSDRTKTMPLDEALEHEHLECFLQMFNPRGQERYEALCARIVGPPLVCQAGTPLSEGLGFSSTSREASPTESEKGRSPTPSTFTGPFQTPAAEAVGDTHVKTDSSPSRSRALVTQQVTDRATFKRERSESPVFLFERPCKKTVVTPAVAQDIQSSLHDWPKFRLTQEPDW